MSVGCAGWITTVRCAVLSTTAPGHHTDCISQVKVTLDTRGVIWVSVTFIKLLSRLDFNLQAVWTLFSSRHMMVQNQESWRWLVKLQIECLSYLVQCGQERLQRNRPAEQRFRVQDLWWFLYHPLPLLTGRHWSGFRHRLQNIHTHANKSLIKYQFLGLKHTGM